MKYIVLFILISSQILLANDEDLRSEYYDVLDEALFDLLNFECNSDQYKKIQNYQSLIVELEENLNSLVLIKCKIDRNEIGIKKDIYNLIDNFESFLGKISNENKDVNLYYFTVYLPLLIGNLLEKTEGDDIFNYYFDYQDKLLELTKENTLPAPREISDGLSGIETFALSLNIWSRILFDVNESDKAYKVVNKLKELIDTEQDIDNPIFYSLTSQLGSVRHHAERGNKEALLQEVKIYNSLVELYPNFVSPFAIEDMRFIQNLVVHFNNENYLGMEALITNVIGKALQGSTEYPRKDDKFYVAAYLIRSAINQNFFFCKNNSFYGINDSWNFEALEKFIEIVCSNKNQAEFDKYLKLAMDRNKQEKLESFVRNLRYSFDTDEVFNDALNQYLLDIAFAYYDPVKMGLEISQKHIDFGEHIKSSYDEVMKLVYDDGVSNYYGEWGVSRFAFQNYKFSLEMRNLWNFDSQNEGVYGNLERINKRQSLIDKHFFYNEIKIPNPRKILNLRLKSKEGKILDLTQISHTLEPWGQFIEYAEVDLLNRFDGVEGYREFSDDELDKILKFLISVRDFYLEIAGLFTLNLFGNISLEKETIFSDIEYLSNKNLINFEIGDSEKNVIKQMLYFSVLASSIHEHLSGNYDFQDHPKKVLDLFIFLNTDYLSEIIKLNNLDKSLSDSESKTEVKKLKNLFFDTVRLNFRAMTKKNMSMEELNALNLLSNKNRILINNLGSEISSKFNLPSKMIISSNEIQKKLSQDQELHYMVSVPSSFLTRKLLFVVNPFTTSVRMIVEGENEISQFIENLSDPKQIGNEEIIKNFSKPYYFFNNPSKIFYAAEGMNRVIPYHLLKDTNGKYLVENTEISYLPHINSFLQEENNKEILSFIGFGNPKIGKQTKDIFSKRSIMDINELPRLEETSEEIIRISEKFKKRKIYLGAEASKRNFFNSSNDFSDSVIYFATHTMPSGNKINDESGLVLTPSNKDDGILTMTEISKMNFENSIVGLSARKTSDSAYLGAEPFSGLAQSFLMGGAKSIYLTLWEIESFSASIFSKEVFNRLVEDDVDLSEAITATSRRFIRGDFGEKYKDPYYWAPYISF